MYSSKFSYNFSKNLKKALSKRGIKQCELANTLGVPVSNVSSWMHGRHVPHLDLLNGICDFLEIPVAELVGDDRSSDDELNELKRALSKKNLEIERLNSELSKRKSTNLLESDLLTEVALQMRRVGLSELELRVKS